MVLRPDGARPYHPDMEVLVTYADALWTLLAQTGWWLLAGLAAAGLVHAFVPAEKLKKQLGGRGVVSSGKAALAGILLPLCSCSVIPVAAGLRRSGASKGATASFAISTPQTGEESIPLTWALLGPVFALTRPVAAIATALVAGTLIDALDRDRAKQPDRPAPEPADTPKPCCSTTISLTTLSVPASPGPDPEPAPAKSCCCHADTPPEPSLSARLSAAMKYAFVTLPLDLAPWLVAGFLLSAAVAAAIPAGWIAEHVGTGLVPMLLMLVVGIPIYICATSSTPLVYTLIVAGLSPGAGLVLLLAGPATNLATIAWAVRDLGVRGTVIYLATVAVVAVAFGLAFDAIAPSLPAVAQAVAHHEHAPSPAMMVGGGVLAALLGVCAAKRGLDALPKRDAASRPCCSHAEHKTPTEGLPT